MRQESNRSSPGTGFSGQKNPRKERQALQGTLLGKSGGEKKRKKENDALVEEWPACESCALEYSFHSWLQGSYGGETREPDSPRDLPQAAEGAVAGSGGLRAGGQPGSATNSHQR